MAHIKPVFEPVYLVDFDFLGMLKLHDAEGIEPLLCPVGDGTYYSRGEIYTLGANPFGAKTAEDFSTISCSEASEFRENYLKPLLNRYPYGKKAFVFAEHMANLSGKVYYEQLQKAIIHKDYSGFEQAKQCLIDDVANIINIIERQKIEKVPDSVLPEGPEILVPRIIECNNMAVLYVFEKNFSVPKDYKILNSKNAFLL